MSPAGDNASAFLDIGSTPAARSRLSGTCPQLWTSTLDEVSNEEADRSPYGRRVRRHDFQRRGANASYAGDTRAIRGSGDARQGGEQEDRQVGRQEKGQGQSQEQEGRSQELKPHRPLGAAQDQKGGTSRLFAFVAPPC